jgi:hypothetical protein
MSVFSPNEDFEQRTLSAVPGLWGKLLYVSSLRQPDGRYEHWGLKRRFGKEAAEKAICSVHQDLVLRTLRMPLHELIKDTTEEATQQGTPLAEFLARLSTNRQMLLPEKFRAGSARHFMTVLESLASLARACTDANRQAS